jgi:DHA1 family bicyclomycin/chloramphenicol resistance-like MFS transporter
MQYIKERHQQISTLLSFSLIPLSGFATDIYIPSLPSMADHLQVSSSAVQLTLVLFMVSAGISQLFVGSLLDSFGRFRLGMAALAAFTLSSIAIALSDTIYMIYAMRVVQGISVALIVVGKRAYFMDRFSGDTLKNYTSLFSIIWATAPIIAPFIGGYLQSSFGWASNFYFLGMLTLVIGLLELKYGGESLRQFQPFKFKPITEVYQSMLRTTDFTLALVIISLCYAMLLVFGMTSPFIIEHVFHYSPVVAGYCSLLSGVALLIGGIISKSLIRKSLTRKIIIAVTLQLGFAVSMIIAGGYASSLYTMMSFVLAIHLVSGFIFNNLFSYCLGRFSKNAGIASGITGGLMYVMASFSSYSLVDIVNIKSQAMLGLAYLLLVILILAFFILFYRARYSFRLQLQGN